MTKHKISRVQGFEVSVTRLYRMAVALATLGPTIILLHGVARPFEWRQETVTISILDVYADDTSDSIDPIDLSIGKPIFIGMHKSGGTGFFWEATSQDNNVTTVTYIRSRTEKPDNTNIVGAPEADVFDVEPTGAGRTAVRFDLRRGKSAPIRSVVVRIHVEG